MAGSINQEGSNYKGYAVVTHVSTGNMVDGPWVASYTIHEVDGEMIKEGKFGEEFESDAEARIYATEKAREFIDELVGE